MEVHNTDTRYKTFKPHNKDVMQENLFFGEPVNIARYDIQKHPKIEQLIEKQISQFWRPEEISLVQDSIDFKQLTKDERHIFLSNLKYQTLLDSVQGRSPNAVLLPITSLPEYETWLETWGFFETIHSRSYTHIMENALPNATEELDSIVNNEEIQKRAASVTKYYDNLYKYSALYNLYGTGTYDIKLTDNNNQVKTIKEIVTDRKLKELLYLTLHSVNALEGIRFYVSFACSFAFAEFGRMSGNAMIVKFIARDEVVHLAGTQYVLNALRGGKDDPEFIDIANDKEIIQNVEHIYEEVFQQENDWAKYLFSGTTSMMGLNEKVLNQYLKFLTNERTKAVGVRQLQKDTNNPVKWVHNKWLEFNDFQNAPQEKEGSSYLVSQIKHDINMQDKKYMDDLMPIPVNLQD